MNRCSRSHDEVKVEGIMRKYDLLVRIPAVRMNPFGEELKKEVVELIRALALVGYEVKYIWDLSRTTLRVNEYELAFNRAQDNFWDILKRAEKFIDEKGYWRDKDLFGTSGYRGG